MKKGTYSGATDPRGEDVDTGSEDVDSFAVVGVDISLVVDVTTTHRAGSELRGRRKVLGISVLVTGSDGGEDTVANQSGDGFVDSSRSVTPNANGGYDALGAVTRLEVTGDIVDASDDGRPRGAATVSEDLDTVELGLLGDTIGLASHSTGAVGSVAVAVGGLAIDEALEEGSTALELGVAGLETGIDDVGAGTLTSAIVISVAGGALCAVGDAGKTPCRRAALVNKALDACQSILLNVFDLMGIIRKLKRKKARKNQQRRANKEDGKNLH